MNRVLGLGSEGLADAGRAEDHDVLTMLDEVAVGELLDLLLVHRRLVAEVKSIQPLSRKESTLGPALFKLLWCRPVLWLLFPGHIPHDQATKSSNEYAVAHCCDVLFAYGFASSHVDKTSSHQASPRGKR